jgi:glycosyltransferase involved in cell wall biosynthesis
MRIIVYPHAMELGGSQLNAIQLAGAVRDRGHQVLVVSEPGPLVARVRELRLPQVELPAQRRYPSPAVARLLARLAERFRADVVHGYEWPPAVEAFLGCRLRGTASVTTIMSMSVVPFLPRGLPLLVGTEAIRARALALGYRQVTLLEPPVDTRADRPGIDGAAFRRRYRLAPDVPLVVMVCRLVPVLKREGLLAACAAVGRLAADGTGVQLAVVGDGPIRAEVQDAADRANALAGRRVVTLTGELADPRPAYAAADVALGMGGSALRAAAFAAPLVVLGEQGFSELLTPDSAPTFLAQGWYGLGPGSLGAGPPALGEAIRLLATDPELRASLGNFARDLVVNRFSLTAAAELQEQVYASALADSPSPAALAADACRTSTGVLAYKLRRKYQAWRGTAPTDDANARPVIHPAHSNHP